MPNVNINDLCHAVNVTRSAFVMALRERVGPDELMSERQAKAMLRELARSPVLVERFNAALRASQDLAAV